MRVMTYNIRHGQGEDGWVSNARIAAVVRVGRSGHRRPERSLAARQLLRPAGGPAQTPRPRDRVRAQHGPRLLRARQPRSHQAPHHPRGEHPAPEPGRAAWLPAGAHRVRGRGGGLRLGAPVARPTCAHGPSHGPRREAAARHPARAGGRHELPCGRARAADRACSRWPTPPRATPPSGRDARSTTSGSAGIGVWNTSATSSREPRTTGR